MYLNIYIYQPDLITARSGSPGEALLAALKGAVKSYVQEFPKDAMWASHLERLYKAEVEMKDL